MMWHEALIREQVSGWLWQCTRRWRAGRGTREQALPDTEWVCPVARDRDFGYDFVFRYFAPASGIPEGPVTGSAHTVLAPYWSRPLGRDSLTGLQATARSGLVRTAVHGDRVHLTGDAVTVFDGTLWHTLG
jgi:predicted PhzF superfamily epimerase YddE/YHI9